MIRHSNIGQCDEGWENWRVDEPEPELQDCDPYGTYENDCQGKRSGVWVDGQLLTFARSVAFTSCVDGPGIHGAVTLIPSANTRAA